MRRPAAHSPAGAFRHSLLRRCCSAAGGAKAGLGRKSQQLGPCTCRAATNALLAWMRFKSHKAESHRAYVLSSFEKNCRGMQLTQEKAARQTAAMGRDALRCAVLRCAPLPKAWGRSFVSSIARAKSAAQIGIGQVMGMFATGPFSRMFIFLACRSWLFGQGCLAPGLIWPYSFFL